eukprot:scaffold197781_cov28-Tisochrysis_lutea.AAC.2
MPGSRDPCTAQHRPRSPARRRSEREEEEEEEKQKGQRKQSRTERLVRFERRPWAASCRPAVEWGEGGASHQSRPRSAPPRMPRTPARPAQ